MSNDPQMNRHSLSAAFISSVHENCPNAVHVFDHFHLVQLMNEKQEYKQGAIQHGKGCQQAKSLEGDALPAAAQRLG